MKLFRFRGGIHPEGHKLATTAKPIAVMPMPKYLYVPLQQHIGAPAESEVKIGDQVAKGQLLAHSQGMVSAPVHAPTSGIVNNISEMTAPHPSGLSVRMITLETNSEDQWLNSITSTDPLRLTAEEVAAHVGAAGIVGMGGATFPSAVKLKLSLRHKIKQLIINGGECEPYLTCDDRLMQERSDQVVDGVRIILRAVQAEKALIAIENNKPEAIAAMQKSCGHYADITVVSVPARYPMGSEKHLIQTVTGLEVPAGGLGADIGVLVHNVGTAYAIHQAIRHGRPLVSRVVTVGGGAIQEPQNVEVPIGASLRDVIEFCGGLKETPARLLMGGPMMGQVMPSMQVPVVKGTSGIIALSEQEVSHQAATPCIRCGSCVDACPCGLLPLTMAAHIRSNKLEGAVDFGLIDCVACGCCSYVCPAHIPLVQYFNYAKGELAARQQRKHKTEETRKLAELRQQRIAKEKEAKRLAAEKRRTEKAKRETATQHDDD